jgi:hypothetical protein
VLLIAPDGEKTILDLGQKKGNGETRVLFYNKKYFGKEETKRFFNAPGRTLLILH